MEKVFNIPNRKGVGRNLSVAELYSNETRDEVQLQRTPRVGKQYFAEGENVRNRGFLKSGTKRTEGEHSSERSEREEVERLRVPYHLGIILDGNRRWAKERGLPVFDGHRKGLETIKKIINYCKEKGIKILTLFVFSTENWKRGKEEVGYLMRLAMKATDNYFKHLHKSKIRVKVIGQREKISKALQKEIAKIERITRNNTEMTVNFALSYGGRAEIVAAVKKIIKNKIPLRKVNENTIKDNLWTSDVDLIIRTGREQRISNFLIWQAAYSELYFYPKYWPDFTEKDLDEAIAEYSRRQRRFGQ